MMPCKYLGIDGVEKMLDLDNVVDIVRGDSKKKIGWSALIVFDPSSKTFVELRDSPPDVKGNSEDEAEEVTPSYISSAFNIDEKLVLDIENNIKEWRFVDLGG
ncbi:MAG: hypothetical protein K9L30_12150 [Desulfobacterales bacterium]|nr:hypothetical protein [Desulfobacterales bacterium]